MGIPKKSREHHTVVGPHSFHRAAALIGSLTSLRLKILCPSLCAHFVLNDTPSFDVATSPGPLAAPGYTSFRSSVRYFGAKAFAFSRNAAIS